MEGLTRLCGVKMHRLLNFLHQKALRLVIFRNHEVLILLKVLPRLFFSAKLHSHADSTIKLALINNAWVLSVLYVDSMSKVALKLTQVLLQSLLFKLYLFRVH